MPQPIVIQLQELASAPNQDVTDLLHKALVVATKLNVHDFRAWILQELNGYENGIELPDYRKVRADLRAENPFHGLIPFIIQEREIRDIVHTVHIRESVNALGQLVKDGAKQQILYYFPPEAEAALMKMQGGPPLRPVRVIGVHALSTVLQAVRTKILDWSLSLEAEGIVGHGHSISSQELEMPMSGKSIRIENFQGILGDIHGASVSQTNTMSIRASDFSSLSRYLAERGVSEQDIAELEGAVKVDPEPKSAEQLGPKVSEWIGKMISRAASGSWQIGAAAAASLLSAAIAKFYGL